MTTTINASTSGGLVQTADTSGILALQTANTTAMTITASQNIGIGTASPSYKLDILTSTGNGVKISDGTTSIETFNSGGVGYTGTGTNHPFGITTNGTERMRITSTGEVGIGSSTTNRIAITYNGGSGVATIGPNSTGGSTALSFGTSLSGTYAEKMRLNYYGNLSLYGATTTANGVGITFPATQSASSDANTLDDYEEGTWSPAVTGFTYSGTITITGSYTKIGRVVRISGSLAASISLSGSGGGPVYFSSLPFTPASGNTGYATACFCDLSTQTPLPNNVLAYGNVYPPTFSFGAGQTLFFTAVYQTD